MNEGGKESRKEDSQEFSSAKTFSFTRDSLALQGPKGGESGRHIRKDSQEPSRIRLLLSCCPNEKEVEEKDELDRQRNRLRRRDTG